MRRAATLLAGLLCASQAWAGPSQPWSVEAPHGPTVPFSATFDEATWSSVDISRDGRTLVFDMLGNLYVMPITGGAATRITQGAAYDAQPRFSPDGKRIAFVSDRDGGNNLWTVGLDGHDPTQITHETANSLSSPAWSPDGAEILALRHDDLSPEDAADLYAFTLAGQGRKLVERSRDPLGPAASPDGHYVYFSTAHGQPAQVQRLDRKTGEIEALTNGIGGAVRPLPSPDGRWLAFGRRIGGQEKMVLRDLETGAERVLNLTLDHDQQDNPESDADTLPGYAFSPDNQALFYNFHGKVFRYDFAAGAPREIPFTAHFEQALQSTLKVEHRLDQGPVQLQLLRWTQPSPDGRTLVFSAAGKIYSYDRATGRAHRMSDEDALEYSPALSPDGRWLAYVGWTDQGLGQVYKTPVDHFAPVRLTTEPGLYEHIAWSPDGRRIVFLQGSGGEKRGEANLEEHQLKTIRWMAADGGGGPHIVLSVAPRGDRRQELRPQFNAAGDRIFFTTTPKKRGDTFLESARLDGSDRRRHQRFRFAEDIMVSPDEHWVAFTEQFETYLAPLDLSRSEIATVRPGQPSVRQLSTEGGYFVNWTGGGHDVTWSWGAAFYDYRLDAPAAAPRKTLVKVSEPRTTAHGDLLLRGARILTMGPAGVIETGDVLVEDSRIKAVGPSGTLKAPATARVIDVAGKTIMPGIIDVHDHYRQGRNVEIFPQNDWGYAAQLAYGITTIRDPSARSQSIFTQAEMIETGRTLGPRTFSSGEPIYFAETAFSEPPSSLDDTRLQVQRLKALGATSIKMYILPRREQRQWVLQASREAGLPALSEGAQKIYFDLSILMDGYTTLEHSIKAAPISKDARSLYSATGVYTSPTLIVGPGGSAEDYFYQHSEVDQDQQLLRFTPLEEVQRRARLRTMRSDADYYFLDLARDTARIVADGGHVALGGHGNLEGLGVHWEMWSMAMGGMSPQAVLRAATIDAADDLGLKQDLGSLEPGKIADLVILDRDPLADIRNSRSVAMVMKAGVLWNSALDEIWPAAKPFAGFYWRRPDGPPPR